MGTLSDLELEGLREDQNQQLDSQCRVWRILAPGTINKDTATYSNPSTIDIYEGPCSVIPILSRRERFDVHADQQIYQNQYRILLPWDAVGIKIGDLTRVTTSEDEDLNLKTMTVKDVLLVSDVSLRRLTVVDIDE